LPLSDEQIEEVESRRDHFSIKGVVEFDGERIVYDEIIQIRTDVGFTSDMGQVRGDNRTLMSRLWIIRPVRSGGVLVMEVPDAGGLWTDLEGHVPPQEKWTPQYVERYLRPPPEFLPEFYWFNDLENPTVAEGYISEAYYEEASARLKIVEPVRLDFVPPSPETEAKAIAQMKAEPVLDFVKGRVGGKAYGSSWWQAVYLVELSPDEWARVPEVVEAVQASGHAVVTLAPKAPEPLLEFAHRTLKRAAMQGGPRYGVPQIRKYAADKYHRYGVLYQSGSGLSADSIVPVSCDAESKVCKALMDRRGFLIFYDNFRPSGGTLDLRRISVPLKFGSAVYQRDTQKLYIIYSSIF
jgi:hypothetical protein